MMTTRIRLSIAIPVYNFGTFLPETIESIFAQDRDDFEVVVTDGASTDSTPVLMDELCARYPNLRYNRLKEKGGIDRDIALAVEATSGEYVWLFSGDDLMHPDAIERILAEVQTGDDIYICKHEECASWMESKGVHPVLVPDIPAKFNLSKPQERLEYLRAAVNSEAFFSFIGGLVVKRSAWERGSLDPRFIGSCFAHSARFFQLMQEGLVVGYINTPLLSRRGDNDSFAEGGYVDRMRIQVDGFHGIVEAHFGSDSDEAFEVRRAIRNEFTPAAALILKYRCKLYPQLESRAMLDAVVARAYKDWTWDCLWTRLQYSLSPAWLIRRRYRWACYAHEHPDLHEASQERLRLEYLAKAERSPGGADWQATATKGASRQHLHPNARPQSAEDLRQDCRLR